MTADETRHLPFRSDTLVNVFSCTKGMASILVAVLVEEGSLPGYDLPLTDVWTLGGEVAGYDPQLRQSRIDG